MKQRTVVLLLLLVSSYVVNAQSKCQNVGSGTVFLDPSCSPTGGLGCNAGGQGQNCRFCGFDVFPPCPTPNSSTQSTKTGTIQSITTKQTTKTSSKKTSTTAKLPTTKVITNTTTSNASKTSLDGPNTDGGGKVVVDNGGYTKPPLFTTGAPKNGERLIFFDDFDTFNLNIWKHDLTMSGGGNWEFQLYHNNRTNSYVKDGVLIIRPTLTAERIGEANLRANYRMDMWGGSPVDQCTGNNFYGCERTAGAGGNILNPIQSAKITTVESFAFKYGRVEVRAKLPKGDWLWPAIWMLPHKNYYGMWPASGEIDIMESRGNKNYPLADGGGVESFGSTLHWGADWTQNRFELTHKKYRHSKSLNDDFHVYGLYWSEDRLYTYIDDPKNIVLDVDFTKQDFWSFGKFPAVYNNPWEAGSMNAPFDQEYYLIINLAVGGTAGYFKDGVADKPWSDKSANSVNEFYAAKANWYQTWKEDPTLQIDYVKVWEFV